MSLSTFADLKSTAATFLNRSNLTSLIPYFVQLTETKIAYGDRSNQALVVEPLRIRAMETPASITVSAQTASLPSNYLQSRRAYLTTNPIAKLTYLVPDIFWELFSCSDTGQPSNFTIEGENYVFGPIPDGTYTMNDLYYQKLTALANDTDTNWVLTNAFGVYLNGVLAEAFSYIRQEDQAVKYRSLFAGSIAALNLADKSDRYSGSPWQAFTDTGNP